jgi:uncharacterized damage-inducible protein DinB
MAASQGKEDPMTVRVPWLDRSFEFGFPLEQVEALMVRLESTPTRLREAVAGVPRDVLVRREDDAWSIQEHVGHLLDLEALHLGRLDDYDDGKDFLGAADLSNRRTDEAGHNDRPIAAILADFRRDRETLVRRLRAMHPERFGQTAIHPRLHIAMRIADMVLFAVEHDDHHLATIADRVARASVVPVSRRSPAPRRRGADRTTGSPRAGRRAG